MSIPQDPNILLSFINTKLRDRYPNLEELCLDLDIDRKHLTDTLSTIDYIYSSEKNRFAPQL